MKNFIQSIARVFHHEIPEENSAVRNTDQETGVKLLQYFMLCILLVLCFLLPGAGVKKEAKESSGLNTGQESGSESGNGSAAAEKSADLGTAADGEKRPDSENAADKKESSDSGNAAGQKGTIVIDAGHGGDDPGMIGPGGVNEKELNLVYAKKLKALLEAQGYRIVMTRETEGGLYDENQSNKKAQDMERRVKIIDESSPLLTVSIHQNSYPDESVSGPQVFYFQHSVEAEKLAASIQDAMNEELEIERPRKHKGNTSYYILKRSSSVTVIVECGFLTNPQEEAKLQEETYQNQVAQAICDGILVYLGADRMALASLQME